MTEGSSLYKIRSSGDSVLDLVLECNRVFGLLSDRLDRMEGYRGKPRFRDLVIMEDDVVVVEASNGLILRDDGNPASYWRITIDSTGSLAYENIGRDYE